MPVKKFTVVFKSGDLQSVYAATGDQDERALRDLGSTKSACQCTLCVLQYKVGTHVGYGIRDVYVFCT